MCYVFFDGFLVFNNHVCFSKLIFQKACNTDTTGEGLFITISVISMVMGHCVSQIKMQRCGKQFIDVFVVKALWMSKKGFCYFTFAVGFTYPIGQSLHPKTEMWSVTMLRMTKIICSALISLTSARYLIRSLTFIYPNRKHYHQNEEPSTHLAEQWRRSGAAGPKEIKGSLGHFGKGYSVGVTMLYGFF